MHCIYLDIILRPFWFAMILQAQQPANKKLRINLRKNEISTNKYAFRLYSKFIQSEAKACSFAFFTCSIDSLVMSIDDMFNNGKA